MISKIISENTGTLIKKKSDHFVVWDRDEKDFVQTNGFSLKKKDSTINHLRDLYNMAKKYGVRKVLTYDWDATKLDIKMGLIKMVDFYLVQGE